MFTKRGKFLYRKVVEARHVLMTRDALLWIQIICQSRLLIKVRMVQVSPFLLIRTFLRTLYQNLQFTTILV